MSPVRDPLAVLAWSLTVADAAWACGVLGPVEISGDDHPDHTDRSTP